MTFFLLCYIQLFFVMICELHSEDILFSTARYWKLSLLVHPDKCSHPEAQQAFTILNQSFKDLQDPTKVSFSFPLFQ